MAARSLDEALAARLLSMAEECVAAAADSIAIADIGRMPPQ